MTDNIGLAEIGALVGDPARAAILHALMDGRPRSAGELAYFARVSPQTASEHLRRLVESRLLAVLPQGRHRYFRIASPRVAHMVEAMGAVATIDAPLRFRRSSLSDEALRQARFCYDHLAGRLAIALADSMIGRRFLILSEDGGELTSAGSAFLQSIGIDLEGARKARRTFCRPCLDWSERRPHVAGAVGAALAAHAIAAGWLVRDRDSRAVLPTESGRAALMRHFAIEAAAPLAAA